MPIVSGHFSIKVAIILRNLTSWFLGLALGILSCSRVENFTPVRSSREATDDQNYQPEVAKGKGEHSDGLAVPGYQDTNEIQAPPPNEEAGSIDPNEQQSYVYDASTEIALEPFAISASLEGNAGDYYYFLDRSTLIPRPTAMRLACRSVRRPPDASLSDRLNIPCVLVMQGETPSTWVHKTFDPKIYLWNFQLKGCPQAILKGTNLFPEDINSKLFTPATMVSLSAHGVDDCAHRNTTLILSVAHRYSDEKYTFYTDLKVEHQDMISIYKQIFISDEKDTIEGILYTDENHFSPWVNGINVYPFPYKKDIQFLPSNPGDNAVISCLAPVIFAVATPQAPSEGPVRIQCFLGNKLPPLKFTRWKIIVSNCPGMTIVANAQKTTDSRTGGIVPIPYALLGVSSVDLEACIKTKKTELIFHIETDQKDVQFIFRSFLQSSSL